MYLLYVKCSTLKKLKKKISKIDHFFQVNNSVLQIFIQIHCMNKVKVAQ